MGRACSAGANAPAPDRGVELADILRAYVDDLGPLSEDQRRVATAIRHCRTPALGGHLHRCDACGHAELLYHSCRDRHCPRCQHAVQERWLEDREAELLPVEYFHVVFTVPDALHPVFRADPRRAYGLLFSAVAETLHEVARTPRHLGAEIGFLAILHTWTQTLRFHPHIHCVVPGGGLSQDGGSWIPAKRGFLFPVRVLGLVFRGKLLSKLEASHAVEPFGQPVEDLALLLKRAARKRWVVFSKRPFAGPPQVLRYLSRYTHRIAISNRRIVSCEDGRVTLRYRDRSDGDREKVLVLDAVTFLRRFLQHVVPGGFVRIRHYGFLANGVKHERLARCRELLGAPVPVDDRPHEEPWDVAITRRTGRDPLRCPACDEGRLRRRGRVPPTRHRYLIPGRQSSP